MYKLLSKRASKLTLTGIHMPRKTLETAILKPRTTAVGLPTSRIAPMQARAHDRVAAILAAAEEEIGEVGFEKLSMLGIAARANMTSTSIYRYFKSVEDLLFVLITHHLNDLEDDFVRLVSQATSADALIATFGPGARLSWKTYRDSPSVRALYAATHYLPRMRAVGDAFNARCVDMHSRRFQELSPEIDPKALRNSLNLVIGLFTPALEIVFRQPKRQQRAVLDEFIELSIWRLSQLMKN